MPSKTVELLLGNLAAFAATNWASKPNVRAADDIGYVKNLLTLEEADRIIKSPSARPPYMEIVRDARRLRERNWVRSAGSRSVMVEDSIDVDVAAEEFSRGSTIIFNHLDEFQAANRHLCDAFESTFQAMSKSMAFITPPGQQGFGVHYDTFEGFILQTHGTKRWYVFEQIRPLTESPRGLRRSDVAEPILEVTLRPGDVLYVPWGSPHYAVSEDTVSCHLTVMVFPGSWNRTLAKQLKSAVPVAAYDELVPFTVANRDELECRAAQHLAGLLGSLQSTNITRWSSQILSNLRPSKPTRIDFLQQAILRASISGATKVTGIPSASVTVLAETDTQAEIGMGSKVMRLPRAFLNIVKQLEDADATQLSDLSGEFSEQSVVTMAGHMVDHGLLRIVPAES